jgi:hypothetical protein
MVTDMKEAEALRDLASKVRQLATGHEAFSMVHERVSLFCEDLCVRARVIELTCMLPREEAR